MNRSLRLGAARLKATAQAPVLDFASTELRPAPSLFSFAFPRSWTGDHTLAISTLVRQNFDLRTDNWLVSPSRRAGAETLF